jgi:hypothetical protein
MGSRKNLISNIIILLILIQAVACSGQKSGRGTNDTTMPGIQATVVDYRELDGCEYLIELQDGTKLQPVNLDNKYKKDQLKVRITWKNFDGAGICMTGTMVELTSISLAAEKE